MKIIELIFTTNNYNTNNNKKYNWQKTKGDASKRSYYERTVSLNQFCLAILREFHFSLLLG